MNQMLLITYCLFLSASAFAFTNYVWQGSPSPVSPFDTWATAAHSIQEAVDVAVEWDVVLVADGEYNVEDPIVIATNYITVKSVNGSAETTVDADFKSSCFSLFGNSVIEGFLIRNGKLASGFGAGVYIFNYGSVVNCLITNNSAPSSSGGGVYCGENSLLFNCQIKGNDAMWGGVFFTKQIVL